MQDIILFKLDPSPKELIQILNVREDLLIGKK